MGIASGKKGSWEDLETPAETVVVTVEDTEKEIIVTKVEDTEEVPV